MGVLASIFFGFVPMFFYAGFVYWLDRYEKEPKLLLGGVFFWGAVVASAGAFIINTTFGVGVYSLTGSEFAADLTTTTIIAPIIEESLKGFAVLLVFFFVRQEMDSVLDGIVYAAVVALGFAATENAYYIYTYGYSQEGWTGLMGMVFIRVLLVGWQHPFYTAFTGIGLAVARLNRNWLVKLTAPLIGLLVAMFTHAFHNTLASLLNGPAVFLGFFFDWTGWLAMFIFILVLINREKRWMLEYLRDEVQLGTLTAPQYHTATSTIKRTIAKFGALTQGRPGPTSRFYQLCAELAHKKRELATLGDENGNLKAVEGLRTELASLSPNALYD
jgi:RsiW-degrading membrane proteinase PrsW (M82 family)